MTNKNLRAGAQLIIRDFQLEKDEFGFLQGELSYDLLEERLTQLIEHLLSSDFSRLLNALYRIDVSEEKFKSALGSNQTNPAKIIAKMIIDREFQKVETRKKYS